MAVLNVDFDRPESADPEEGPKSLWANNYIWQGLLFYVGLLRHLGKRGLFLFITLVLAMYMVVIVANLGGKIDDILESQIRESTAIALTADPGFTQLPPEEQDRIFNETVQAQLSARGLDQPFIQRSFIYTANALTLNLGTAMFLKSNAGSSNIFEIIIERLPITVLLFTTGSVLAAVFGILLGLRMASKGLKPFDRGMTIFSVSTFIVPHWIFGILFILVFGFSLRWFPTRGFVDVPPPPELGAYILSVLHHMSLPLITVVFSSFGFWAYITRNLVLQIMEEDFVTAARAKGLPEKTVLHRYVLRAASPPIVTSMALALIASWTGAIITETVFQWPGLGLLYFQAISVLDATVVIGLTVMYAVLLVITVFILDLVYSYLDPRIRAAGR